ncbi:error-prone DNA polymerase [Xylophilus sp.]|uniref:error-prone DNA polymerase n=1 Tax=Xylophilus sp. TaxID=2653893 RepID=UPI0013B82060|nr:error-prone DNA polymerase [Xylophilus sp.]KAF1048076.1 MAG: Error-prone DNA polymerase [Xylophilus sp.]
MADEPFVLPDYAELHCLSNFSFQRGASHPQRLVERAVEVGYRALAITDECSVAGVVQAHVEAKAQGLQLLPGASFALDGFTLVILPHDLRGWGHLCECITRARRRAVKGSYAIDRATGGFERLARCEAIAVPDRTLAPGDVAERLRWLHALFGERAWAGCELLCEMDDALWLETLAAAGEAAGVPLVATGGVRMADRGDKSLHDVLTAIAMGCAVDACGFALASSGERHLRARSYLGRLYPPALMQRTLVVAERCRFSLDEIREAYQYPLESVGRGLSAMDTLRLKVAEGAHRRCPEGIPPKVQAAIDKELGLIEELDYAMYFLTVEDIVRFARSRNILCQGRGSAANSAVCYCLGITELSPETGNLLFERFLSRERREPPDIDVDFEHERREEVIQYIYETYGRERAAIAAVVIRYQSRSAIRDAGKAMGIDAALIDLFARDRQWFDSDPLDRQALEAALERVGRTVEPALFGRIADWLRVAQALHGFPRHLSQHVGGFVLTQGPLSRLVPIENAAMKERSVIQWEKDDLEAVGLMKVDVLALGMLSALRRCRDFVAAWTGRPMTLQDIPQEDPRVYDMLCEADSVGVFQVESRAQMSMLPRLRPRTYYDLVVEVAIVRPGPIQGGMVHPYLHRRQLVRDEQPLPDEYPALHDALGRTLGVPIFQEQVMQIAMIAAGFSADEADRLRRSMAAWKRHGGIDHFKEKIVEGMTARGYPEEFAERIFKQMQGFGDYGFPESHAASFALLVYQSSWFRRHHLACFLAALINAQPMGFYTPSQLVQDARRHGVEVRPVCVLRSDWDCTLEAARGRTWGQGRPAVRLGLRLVAGLGEKTGERLCEARAAGGAFADAEDLALRAALDVETMQALAAADALAALAGHRRQQMWDASAPRTGRGLLRRVPVHEAALALPEAPEGEAVRHDYAATGLTLRRHPVALLREQLARWRISTAQELRTLPHQTAVRTCGIVSVRQRPPTAKGTVFVTLEDETGTLNVIVWPRVAEAWRTPLLAARLLAVEGFWQHSDDELGPGKTGAVRHLVARRLADLTHLLGTLSGQGVQSRDFR